MLSPLSPTAIWLFLTLSLSQLLFSTSLLITPGVESMELSCSSVYDDVDDRAKFCTMVTWLSAQMYNASNYSLYYPGLPLSVVDQDRYAKELYQSLRSQFESDRPSCKNALKRLACAQVFPECPEPGLSMSGVSYFPTCAAQCQQAEALCNQRISCSNFSSFNCMTILPPGYFILSPTDGPYDALPGLYGAVLGTWILLTLYWHLAAFVFYKDSSVVVCKAVSTIPLVKVVVLILGTSFWSTCNLWKMCSFWLGVSLINTHLVFETGMMICFLLVGKGWSITRDNFSANEWRGIIMSMSAFYMCDSIILVLDTSVLTQQGFWIANTILYGLMYFYIIWNVQEQLLHISKQVKLLGSDVPPAIGGPLREKRRMYIYLQGLILISAALEVYLHSLRQSTSHVAQVLFVYELSDLFLLGLMGFIFRPREHSPFFLMIPATIQDDRTRPIPMIEGTSDDDSSPCEVELHPLLHPRDRQEQENPTINPTRLMFVRNPNQTINVAISPSPNHILGIPHAQGGTHHHNHHRGASAGGSTVTHPATIGQGNGNGNGNSGNGNGNGNGNGGRVEELELGIIHSSPPQIVASRPTSR